MVPALGTDFERSTELTDVLQSLGDGVKIGVPELKYENDYGNNMLFLRRPACQGTGGWSCHVSHPLRQTGSVNPVPEEFPGVGEMGRACFATLFRAKYVPVAHHLVAQNRGQEATAFVIQYYEYEKVGQAF